MDESVVYIYERIIDKQRKIIFERLKISPFTVYSILF